jgi:hypothetical protein
MYLREAGRLDRDAVWNDATSLVSDLMTTVPMVRRLSRAIADQLASNGALDGDDIERCVSESR